jgi:hypothetical protein
LAFKARRRRLLFSTEPVLQLTDWAAHVASMDHMDGLGQELKKRLPHDRISWLFSRAAGCLIRSPELSWAYYIQCCVSSLSLTRGGRCSLSGTGDGYAVHNRPALIYEMWI